ncbi:hypothetical protein BN961_02173 [Afipia felis]|uniref:HNH nuclease domain-containing protein n=1 Tax=Afipia felis TaxID=1035 RepID=A0A090MMY6_AFIFE|nr:HNH endonuclease [Afipia felis]CEG08755.1 hypothetical protein BN961_02173 [Afipia felis]
MSRTVPEWIGKTDDTKVPAHVRARIFKAHGGKCYLSGRIIRAGEPWELDHIVALVNGGENRETNLAPAIKDKHREKTAKDVAEKATVARKFAKNIGIRKPSRLKGQGFRPSAKQHSASRPLNRKSEQVPA